MILSFAVIKINSNMLETDSIVEQGQVIWIWNKMSTNFIEVKRKWQNESLCFALIKSNDQVHVKIFEKQHHDKKH